MEGLYVRGRCAVLRWTGQVVVETVVAMLLHAMAECQRAGVVALLLDARALVHAPLTATDFFKFGHQVGTTWDRGIKLGLLVRPDQVDREAFAATVAGNRGLELQRFTDEDTAAAWLEALSLD